MKRVIIPAAFLVMGIIAGTCLAAPKAPAKICLQPDDRYIEMAIVTKSAGGAMSLENGTFKFSHVVGEMVFPTIGWSMPIKGSGHMNGDVFHFFVTGGDYLETLTLWTTVEFEGKWNVSTRTGWWRLFLLHRNSTGEQVGYDVWTGTNLHDISCSAVSIPY